MYELHLTFYNIKLRQLKVKRICLFFDTSTVWNLPPIKQKFVRKLDQITSIKF